MAPKLDFSEDYYSVLEVEPFVNFEKLKKAYYKMVFKYHPDNKENDEAKSLCNKQMMVINGAYSVLKDSEKREFYDSQRKRGYFGTQAFSKGNGSMKSKNAATGSASTSSSAVKDRRDASKAGQEGSQSKPSSSSSTAPGGAWRRWTEQSETGRRGAGESGFGFRTDDTDDDLDDMMNEDWFDEELKEKLRAYRQRERQKEMEREWEMRRTGGSRGTQEYTENTRTGNGFKRSILEEVAELLKEEERAASNRAAARESANEYDRWRRTDDVRTSDRSTSSSWQKASPNDFGDNNFSDYNDDSEFSGPLRSMMRNVKALEREVELKEQRLMNDPRDW